MDETAILSNPKTVQNRIYVGNLSSEATASLINAKFSHHGKIFGISRKGPSFCFIEFSDQISAQSAIISENGTNFCGRKITVKQAETNNNSRKRKLDVQEEQSEMSYSSFNSSDSDTFHHFSTNSSSKFVHCAIFIADENLQFYAETIKQSLSGLDFSAEIIIDFEFREALKLFRSRGGVYAIQVNKYHEITRTMTVTSLTNVSRENPNLSFYQAMKFIYHDFHGRTGSISDETTTVPENILKLLNKLFYNIRLTEFQYSQLITFLDNERKIQTRMESGKSSGEKSLPNTSSKPIDETKNLQQRIFEILIRNRIRGSDDVSLIH